MDDTEARELLDDLVKMGALRIITNLPAPDRPTEDARDPAFNVQDDVVAIEDYPDGLVLARGASGALTIGAPLDLLVRLAEWRHFDAEHPEQTRARTLAALDERR